MKPKPAVGSLGDRLVDRELFAGAAGLEAKGRDQSWQSLKRRVGVCAGYHGLMHARFRVFAGMILADRRGRAQDFSHPSC